MSTKINNSEAEILTGIKRQNMLVLKIVYNRYYSLIKDYVCSNNGSPEDAQDVFQETIIILFRKVNEVDFKLTSSLQSFIFSIARLIWLKELERKQKRKLIENEVGAELNNENELIEIVTYNHRLKLFREKFEQLSDDCKRVLRLFLNGLNLDNITEVMGYSSVQHTKNRRYRCKEHLIKTIKLDKRFEETCYGKSRTN